MVAMTSPLQDFCVLQLLHFCTFLLNPYFDLEPDYIRKPIKRRFSQYLVRTEILSTFHTRVEYISGRTIHHSAHSKEWGRKCRKITETALFLETRGPPSDIPIPRPIPLTTQVTASGSNQPFCRNTLCGQTDRETDRPTNGRTEADRCSMLTAMHAVSVQRSKTVGSVCCRLLSVGVDDDWSRREHGCISVQQLFRADELYTRDIDFTGRLCPIHVPGTSQSTIRLIATC